MNTIALSLYRVTPCVGVWIEMPVCEGRPSGLCVTPCVGVWIEIIFPLHTGQR